MAQLHRIEPCLWFDGEAEDAAKYYVSIFPNSSIDLVTHYGKAGNDIHGQPEGRVMTVQFRLDGQPFLGLNGGPQFKFTEAVSFTVRCETQEEIDYYWEKLSAGGKPGPCGWLKDRYGLSWQVAPSSVMALFASKDRAAADRVMKAVMGMGKLDIAALKKAQAGG